MSLSDSDAKACWLWTDRSFKRRQPQPNVLRPWRNASDVFLPGKTNPDIFTGDMKVTCSAFSPSYIYQPRIRLLGAFEQTFLDAILQAIDWLLLLSDVLISGEHNFTAKNLSEWHTRTSY